MGQTYLQSALSVLTREDGEGTSPADALTHLCEVLNGDAATIQLLLTLTER